MSASRAHSGLGLTNQSRITSHTACSTARHSPWSGAMGCNDLLSLGYKRRGEGTEWGIAFAEDEVLPDCDQSPSPLSLSFSADSGGCLCFVESPCASSRAPLRCLHACVFLCVHVSQRISAYRLTGCILDHLIYCLIHCSFSVVSSLWPSVRSCAVIPYYSSFYFVIPWFRNPTVPHWFLLCVQNNTKRGVCTEADVGIDGGAGP